MNRPQYNKATRTASIARANFHANILHEVTQCLEQHDILIIGMSLNPVVSRSIKTLKSKKLPFHYLEYGGYFSMWKERLAIKMWSGWPTFPQIFVKGVLIGGNQELEACLKDGTLQKILDGESDE